MAIAPVSGGSAQPARANTQPVKGVSMDFKPQEKPESIIAQENKDSNALKVGVANEDFKGVNEVDVKI